MSSLSTFAIALSLVQACIHNPYLDAQQKPPSQKTPGQAIDKRGKLPPVPWIDVDIDKVKSDVTAIFVEKKIASKRLNAFAWNDRKNIHARLIALLHEIPEIKQLLTEIPKRILSDDFQRDQSFVNPNVEFEVAILLVKKDRHDLALDLLRDIEFKHLAQPGLALVYKTICLHKQVQSAEALICAETLVANRDQLSLRYRDVADSLYADLLKQNEEPLQTVARLMSDVGRRQNLMEQSDRALEQEEEILRKLDEIIKDLEKQKKRMAAASNSRSQPSPTNPENGKSQSLPGVSGQNSTGDVASKEQSQDGNWGALSDEQKAISVKTLVRELPPHFQTLLKAYFQKLAEESK